MGYELKLYPTHVKKPDDTYLSLDAMGLPTSENSLGITGANVSEFAQVKTVNDNGVPTSWETSPLPIPKGGMTGQVLTKLTNSDYNTGWQSVGDIADKTYIHTQYSAVNVWQISHGLNKFPSVTVVDSAGSTVVGEIKYINTNNITITFSAAFSGKAYLN